MTTQPAPRFPASVSTCVFLDGIHVYSGPDCPHARAEDEQGEIQPLGWTVQ